MNSKKSLLGLLALAGIIELFLSSAGFVAPAWLLTQFKLPANPDTLFLGHVIAWLLFFVASACALAFVEVRRGRVLGWAISYYLGAWWIGIGVGIFAGFGRIDNLFLDSLKGALILVAAGLSRSQASGR